jgi:co-chaperonin GroES (HSP10)
MIFQPLGDRIRIKADSVKTVTDSGLNIPTSAQDKPVTGVVMAIGPKVNSFQEDFLKMSKSYMEEFNDASDVRAKNVAEYEKRIAELDELYNKKLKNVPHISVGDRVVFSEFAGVRVNVDGEELLYVKEGDCHFVITPENE